MYFQTKTKQFILFLQAIGSGLPSPDDVFGNPAAGLPGIGLPGLGGGSYGGGDALLDVSIKGGAHGSYGGGEHGEGRVLAAVSETAYGGGNPGSYGERGPLAHGGGGGGGYSGNNPGGKMAAAAAVAAELAHDLVEAEAGDAHGGYSGGHVGHRRRHGGHGGHGENSGYGGGGHADSLEPLVVAAAPLVAHGIEEVAAAALSEGEHGGYGASGNPIVDVVHHGPDVNPVGPGYGAPPKTSY